MKIPFFARLQTQLTLLAITLVLTPLLIVVFVIINQMNNQAHAQVINQLEVIVKLKRDHIIQWLAGAESILGIIASNQEETLLMGQMLAHETPDPVILKKVNDYLAHFNQIETVFKTFIIYNVHGEVIAASDMLELGKNTRLQPYFEASLLANRIHPPYYNVSKNELSIVVTHLIRGQQGAVVGVLAGEVDISVLSEIMGEDNDFNQTDETILVSGESGYFLTPSRFKGYVVTRKYSSYIIDQILQGQDGAGIYEDYRTPPVKVVAVYHWIPELQAGLMAKIDEAEAVANFTLARNEGLLVAGLAGMVALLFGLYQANAIVAPIIQLTKTAQQVAEGKLVQVITNDSANEIGVLALAFNHMLQQIQHLVADLSAKNEALEESMLAAQTANKAKSEFLTTMSHELRTPLNAVIGFSEVLMFGLDGELSSQAQQDVELIHSSGEHLLRLVNDVLDISKIEAGLMEIVPEPLLLNDTVQSVLATVSTLVELSDGKRKDLIFETSLPADLPLVFADPIRLKQILLNLVENSIKFTQQGKIEIRARQILQQLEISINDTGIGIPLEMQAKIFDSFTQVDMSSTRVYGGTGLGLSICKHLVTLHGGTIGVESEVNQGTTVTFTLPIYEANNFSLT